MELNHLAAFLISLPTDPALPPSDCFPVNCPGDRKIHDDLMESMLDYYRKETTERQKHAEDGHLFNVFDLWNRFSGLGETVHSRLIHFLLYPDPRHSQGRKYLVPFLEMLGVSKPMEGNWTITAEKGRVDVRLVRDNPKSVILIENKSNWAVDQHNQIYRYWYQNIHTKREDCSADYYVDKDFRIIYLAPNKWKDVSEDSLSKPSREWFGQCGEYDCLPDMVPISPITWTFDNEFAEWLRLCIDITPEGNTPLRNYLTQYMNYCKKL